MWSLPDITRLNNRAASEKDKFEQAIHSGVLDGEALTCEYNGDHSGELSHELWYDIFSDDPKGIVSMCEHHRDYHGSIPEGYFNCNNCERLMIENYTWELYSTRGDGDELLCLPCALNREIDKPENWIRLTKKDIARITFPVLRRLAKHLIGVEMPVPDSIKFYDNATFDGMDGHLISGEDIQSILTRAKNAGYRDAMLILDGGFQFAVSIGVYVKGIKAKGKVKGGKAA